MFTGLVETTAKVIACSADHVDSVTTLVLDAPAEALEDVGLGDSIALNGCCLTVTAIESTKVQFQIGAETARVTTLGSLKAGDIVNLERALKMGARLGGHLVSGHVDGLGRVEQLRPGGQGWLLETLVPRDLGRYLIVKGSICLDGVSLTVNGLKDRSDGTLVSCLLIPATLQKTILGSFKVGQQLNVEVDPIGKYIERLMDVRLSVPQ